MDRIFFTSDTHFGHKNILRFGKGRPWEDIDEHDEALIKNWNDVVEPGDRIYHLGDFSMSRPERVREVLSRLNGQIFLVRGNHDKNLQRGETLKYFVWSKEYFKLKIRDEDSPTGKQEIVLFHFPIESWDKRHYGAWHLHGHCVDLQTEILTEEGWKKRHLLSKKDRVLSYDNSENTLFYNDIDEIIDIEKYTGDVYKFSGKSVNLRVTDNHVLTYFDRKRSFCKKRASDFFLDTNRAGFLLSGFARLNGLGLPKKHLALLILVAADGSIKRETNLVRIRVTKERKKQYIRQVLKLAEVSYKEHTKNNYTSFNFYIPSSLEGFGIKGLDRKLLNCSRDEFEEILEAYSFSDGYRNGNGYVIYSSKEEEIDILQQLSIMNGWSATKHSRVYGFGDKTSFQLSVYPRQIVESVNISEKVSITKVDKPEHFWCIKCRFQNFFIRREGKVHLTGNCHGNLESPEWQPRLDVGVDNHGFAPISYEEVKEHMKTKTFKPLDHHSDKRGKTFEPY